MDEPTDETAAPEAAAMAETAAPEAAGDPAGTTAAPEAAAMAETAAPEAAGDPADGTAAPERATVAETAAAADRTAGRAATGNTVTQRASEAETDRAAAAEAGALGAFGFGLPFGTCDAAVLAALADLADRFGDGTLRPTPWRALLLPGVAAADRAALEAGGAALGLVVRATDPRRLIIACPGRGICASGLAATREDAARLAASPLAGGGGDLASAAIAAALGGRTRTESGGTLAGPPGLIHLSGCAKGCAHPGPAALTLIGTKDGYGIVLEGNAGDEPEAILADISALWQTSPALRSSAP